MVAKLSLRLSVGYTGLQYERKVGHVWPFSPTCIIIPPPSIIPTLSSSFSFGQVSTHGILHRSRNQAPAQG